MPAAPYFNTMLPLVHFVISIGIAFSLELKSSRKYALIIFLGIIGILPDIDHLLPLNQGARLFHNTIFLGALPMLLVVLSNLAETNRGMKSSAYQRFFVCVALILLSHLLLDIIDGNTITLGIFNNPVRITMPLAPLIQSNALGVLFTTRDAIWMLLIVMVLTGNVILKRIYALYEGYEDGSEYAPQAFEPVPERSSGHWPSGARLPT